MTHWLWLIIVCEYQAWIERIHDSLKFTSWNSFSKRKISTYILSTRSTSLMFLKIILISFYSLLKIRFCYMTHQAWLIIDCEYLLIIKEIDDSLKFTSWNSFSNRRVLSLSFANMLLKLYNSSMMTHHSVWVLRIADVNFCP